MALPVPPPPARESFLVNGFTAPAWVLWFNQVWRSIRYDNLIDAVDDAAAASAGVGKGQLYRTGSNLKVRIT